jgi:hypothetical protein
LNQRHPDDLVAKDLARIVPLTHRLHVRSALDPSQAQDDTSTYGDDTLAYERA